jgi:uncharacterized protein YegL
MSDIDIPDRALTDNNSQRLPCALVIDGSGSMAGPAMDELNAGLQLLEQELKNDDVASLRVQVLVIRFGDSNQVEVVSDWKDAMDFQAPRLKANGSTPMGAAVTLALNKIEEQKARYKANGIAYNRPWLFLLTDGEPTDTDWEQAAGHCRAAEQEGKVVFFGIGVGQANLATLGRFSSRQPLRLQGLKFRELFVWLSQSAKVSSKAAQGSNVQLSAPSDWAQVPT